MLYPIKYILLATIITTTTVDTSKPLPENNPHESFVSFTLSGTVTNDHPDLSWNSVSGASYYVLRRLPVPFFGIDKEATFTVSSTSFIDEDVNGAVLGAGFQQVRYRIDAYNDCDNLLDSAGPVDYTADSIN